MVGDLRWFCLLGNLLRLWNNQICLFESLPAAMLLGVNIESLVGAAVTPPHVQDGGQVVPHWTVGLQDADGSWWDYPLYDYHQQYGTAYAIMTLHRCRRPPP